MFRWGSWKVATSSIMVVALVAMGCTSGETGRGEQPRETRATNDRDTVTTTTTGPSSTDPSTTTSTTEGGIDIAGGIGVLGCSNTAQHVDGYLAASELDLLIPTPLGGGDLDTWADSSSQGYESHWQELLESVPPGSIEDMWVQICPRRAGAQVTSAEENALTSIVDRLRAEYGDIAIAVSGINLYEEGYVCRKMGEHGVGLSWALADWGVANLGLVRGPETGPLGPGTVDEDGCHLSPAGEALVGQQLVEWFDGP